MFEKKYKIIFLRKEYSTMRICGVLHTNKLKNLLRYKGKTYHVNIEFPCFSSQKSQTYIFDFDSGNQLKFDMIEAILKPEELDLIVSNQIVKELTSSAISDKKDKIINIILGFILGALVSALLMFMYMQNKIQSIYDTINFNPIGIGV